MYICVSRYGATRIEISGQEYECNGQSDITLLPFLCSLFPSYVYCSFFFFFFFFPPHSHTALRIHSVSFLATSFFSSAPGTRAPTQQTRLSWFCYDIPASVVAQRSVLVDCTRMPAKISTVVPAGSISTTSLQNFTI